MSRKTARDLESLDAYEEWAASLLGFLDNCLGLPPEKIDHDKLCELVEHLVCHNFYYAREVRGVNLAQKAHVQTDSRAREYHPRCDFLMRPKERLIELGFPDMYLCVEVKSFGEGGLRNKDAVFNDAIRQCIDYNNSVFFLSKKHADPQGNPLVPGSALRPFCSFVFYNGNLFGEDAHWPFNVSSQCQVGRLLLVSGLNNERLHKLSTNHNRDPERLCKEDVIGWEFDVVRHTIWSQGLFRFGDGFFDFRHEENALPKNQKVASGSRPLVPPIGDYLKHKIPYKEKWSGKGSGKGSGRLIK